MNKYIQACFVTAFAVITVGTVAFWKGMDSFIFAWVLNFILMMGVLFFTQTFKPTLRSSYYKVKEWEASGKIYKWLGVNLFRKILVWVGWEKLNKAANPVTNKVEALKLLEYRTRQSEFGHLIIFFIVLIFNIIVVFHYGFIQSLWLFFLNLTLNVYPVLVQRYNRPRLQKIVNSAEKKKSTNA